MLLCYAMRGAEGVEGERRASGRSVGTYLLLYNCTRTWFTPKQESKQACSHPPPTQEVREAILGCLGCLGFCFAPSPGPGHHFGPGCRGE